jgi:ectoine hydroxylase-related dioxygenase (phytanoyl-CoA dioxygenase family)
MTTPLKSYGVREFTSLSSEADRCAEEIRIRGYGVIAGALSESELGTVRAKLDEVYEAQVEEIGGEGRLREMNDAHIVRLLLAYDDYFLRPATHPTVLAVVGRLLGDYFIIGQQNGIINPPAQENYQVSWHRDLSYQHFVSSRPLAVSALFCIDDFSEETGGTHVLPASHKTEPFPSAEFVGRNELCVTAQAGSVLVFDSMLYHRAGHNRSNFKRRALNHMYTLPFLKQQISMPEALQGRFGEDEFLRRFLGYESEPGKSVAQWRNAKIERARGLAKA